MSEATLRSSNTLHICFVHGWQGDHTSFQSFPTDLHNYLQPRMPTDVVLNTHIYPTYKAARPIQESVDKLLKWLETLPSGHVILAGHSLGGYLTADAALESNRIATLKHRIIGMIAFDTPYLGIHPHVIISGIASILPDNGAKEAEMNDETKVNIPSPKGSVLSLDTPATSPPPVPSAPSFFEKASQFFSKHGHDPIGYTKRYITEFFEFGSSVVDKEGLSDRYVALEKWGDSANPDGGDWIHFFTVAVKKDKDTGAIAASDASEVSSVEQSSPYVFHPHRHRATESAPATVGAIPVEINPYGSDHTEEEVTATGSALEFDRFKEAARREKAKFDKKRTEQAAQKAAEAAAAAAESSKPSRPDELTPRGSARSSLDPSASTTSLASHRSADSQSEPSNPSPPAAKKKKHSPHHFIVLPWTMGYRWQGIPIEGVDDEVAAHTGIFFRSKNFEYDSLVERAGNFVLGVVRKHNTSRPAA